MGNTTVNYAKMMGNKKSWEIDPKIIVILWSAKIMKNIGSKNHGKSRKNIMGKSWENGP